MKNIFTILLLFCFSAIAYSQHTNILIGDTDNPEEPSIMINPKNTNQIVAGANIDLYYYSNDAGLTWTQGNLSSSHGVWGDPTIMVDTAGSFYFFHLSNPASGNWIDRIVCQKLDTIGGTWSDGSYMGLNGTKAQDKQWTVVDRANNNIYVTWTQFDEYGTSNSQDSSVILFSKSTDAGETWTNPQRISKTAGDCIDSDNTTEGAVPTVGPNGEIYVSWAGPQGLMFDKSLDQGETWLENDIFVSDIPGGWDYMIPGIQRCNGLPVTICDLSNGPNRGTIYINWSDQRNGTTDTDIWLIKSTDGGETWSQRIRVNNDSTGKQQFFTWMAIDEVTGYLYFVFYDRRNYSDNKTDVYMAVSKDGGETISNFKISETPFTPSAGIFFGDYTNISVHNNVIRPIWTRLSAGKLSVWTAIVDTAVLGIEKPEPILFSLEQNFPNPFYGNTEFAFKMHQASIVSLQVYDMFGKSVAKIINQQLYSTGKYFIHFDAEKYNLKSGVYYFSLICNEKTVTRKMVYLK